MKKLVFVYNADSGRLNLAFDIAHKILSPSTYQCDLCAITHGYFQMHAAWRSFIDRLAVEVEYLHRDEYPDSAPPAEVPVILLQQELGEYSILLGAADIAACDSAEELQTLISEGLAL